MRFQFYTDEIADLPKLSVDGTVDNSIHFSHWEGNETPEEVKADTSTEIRFEFGYLRPNRDELTQGIDLVTNNHFDTDGPSVSLERHHGRTRGRVSRCPDSRGRSRRLFRILN
jgi:hypothetical protein